MLKKLRPVWKHSNSALKPKYLHATVHLEDGKTLHGAAVRVSETSVTVKCGEVYWTFPTHKVTLSKHPLEGGE